MLFISHGGVIMAVPKRRRSRTKRLTRRSQDALKATNLPAY